jgi:hypothetical protein
MPGSIAVRFSYDPYSYQVDYLDLSFDGTRAFGDDGKVLPLARGRRALTKIMRERGEGVADAHDGRLPVLRDKSVRFDNVQDAAAD